MYYVLANLAIFSSLQAKELRFNENGKFKIVQFTDVHLGRQGGKSTDLETIKLMGEILDKEKPELVVITGDFISGTGWDKVTKDWTAQIWAEGV